jgi:hypothetical protein
MSHEAKISVAGNCREAMERGGPWQADPDEAGTRVLEKDLREITEGLLAADAALKRLYEASEGIREESRSMGEHVSEVRRCTDALFPLVTHALSGFAGCRQGDWALRATELENLDETEEAERLEHEALEIDAELKIGESIMAECEAVIRAWESTRGEREAEQVAVPEGDATWVWAAEVPEDILDLQRQVEEAAAAACEAERRADALGERHAFAAQEMGRLSGELEALMREEESRVEIEEVQRYLATDPEALQKRARIAELRELDEVCTRCEVAMEQDRAAFEAAIAPYIDDLMVSMNAEWEVARKAVLDSLVREPGPLHLRLFVGGEEELLSD